MSFKKDSRFSRSKETAFTTNNLPELMLEKEGDFVTFIT